MNMHTYNPEMDDNAIHDEAIDSALANYPIVPLPVGFTRRVMESVAMEPTMGDSPVTGRVREQMIKSARSYLSLNNLYWLWHNLYRELASIRTQLRSMDVAIAAFFALLWCVVAGTFIWTGRLVSSQPFAPSSIGQATWLIPLCIVIGGCLALGMLALFWCLEQRDS